MTDPDKPTCDCCSSNDPNYSPVTRMREMVAQNGFGVLGVFPDPDYPESFWFSYTVGLTEKGLPELVVTGMPSKPAHTLLTILYETIMENVDSWRYFFADGGGLRPAEGRFLQDGLEFEFVEVNPRGTPPLGVAHALYGDRVRAFQVMFPDDNYRLPSALEYNAKDFPQPILERA